MKKLITVAAILLVSIISSGAVQRTEEQAGEYKVSELPLGTGYKAEFIPLGDGYTVKPLNYGNPWMRINGREGRRMMNGIKAIAMSLLLMFFISACGAENNTAGNSAAGAVTVVSSSTSTPASGSMAENTGKTDSIPYEYQRLIGLGGYFEDGKFFVGKNIRKIKRAFDPLNPDEIIGRATLIAEIRVTEALETVFPNSIGFADSKYKADVLNVLAGKTNNKELVLTASGGEITLRHYIKDLDEKKIIKEELDGIKEEDLDKMFVAYHDDSYYPLKLGESYVVAVNDFGNIIGGGYGIFKKDIGTDDFKNVLTEKPLPSEMKILKIDDDLADKYTTENTRIENGKFFWSMGGRNVGWIVDPKDPMNVLKNAKSVVFVKVLKKLEGTIPDKSLTGSVNQVTPYQVSATFGLAKAGQRQETVIYIEGGDITLDKVIEAGTEENDKLFGYDTIAKEDLKRIYLRMTDESYVDLIEGEEYIVALDEDGRIAFNGYGVFIKREGVRPGSAGYYQNILTGREFPEGLD